MPTLWILLIVASILIGCVVLACVAARVNTRRRLSRSQQHGGPNQGKSAGGESRSDALRRMLDEEGIEVRSTASTPRTANRSNAVAKRRKASKAAAQSRRRNRR